MVWVEVRMRRAGHRDEVSIRAFINGGFRAGRATINLPAPLAELLGFDVRSAELSRDYTVAGGGRPPVRDLGEVEVKVVVPDRDTEWLRAHAICVEGEDEALISRELAGLMRIEESYSRSAWRFEDDPPGTYRPEARPQYWAVGERGG